MSPRRRTTEHDAYYFIEENLKSLGWDTRQPPEGQVYTQNECLNHPEIQKAFGAKHPENIVKISETQYWVIEAKKEHSDLQKAVDEARERLKKINESSNLIKVKIISGVAGNKEDSYLIKNEFFDGNDFKTITINGKEASGLLSSEEVEMIISQNNPDLKDIVIDETLFLSKAEKINEILHNGAINKNQRAKVMAALLLSMVDVTPPNINATPRGLIRDINTRAVNVLENEGKPEFKDLIKITLPPSPDNHVKYKKALVDTIQELNILNIRSAMNSGADVLGKFYEVFLKYGNGAKEIGIVLTPRHITKFAVEVLNVGVNDIVYDPTCGTGGFLVSAFDYVKNNANEEQIDKFKENNLFGVEQEPEVVALAIVNMIFRGDGKNNIQEGNCFHKKLVPTIINGISTATFTTTNDPLTSKAVTKVLMNPPFAKKDDREKEYHFIDHALEQMQDGSILFSVLPLSVLIERNTKTWRKEVLVKNNTLLSVVTFPMDLFYPTASNHCVGIFIKKGIPHPSNQNVLWIRAMNDGFLKKKGKRLFDENADNDFESIEELLKNFVHNPSTTVETIPEFQNACSINFEDTNFELVPEEYIDEKQLSEQELKSNIDSILREAVAYLIKNCKIQQSVNFISKTKTTLTTVDFHDFPIHQLFDVVKGKGNYIKHYDPGEIPLISATNLNNGIVAEVYDDPAFEAPCITVERVSGTAFVQLDDFITVPDDISVLIPKKEYPLEFLFYVSGLIFGKRWKYCYGRKLSKGRLEKITLRLPITEENYEKITVNSIDMDYIKNFVENLYGWDAIEKYKS